MSGKLIFLWLLTVIVVCEGCDGRKVYKVGGSSGWTNTNIAPSHYKYWAASKIFHVRDIIRFEYNKKFHSVVRVTHKNFNSCNSTAPLSTWATGNDSFAITRPGHYYFICGLPGHCWAGQKVDIRVLQVQHRRPPGPSPSPKTSVSPSPSPSGPSPEPVPVPSAQSGKSGSSWNVWLLVAAISLPAYMDIFLVGLDM